MRLSVRLDPLLALRGQGDMGGVSLLKGAVAADLAGADGVVCRLQDPSTAEELLALRKSVGTHLGVDLAPGDATIRAAQELQPDLVTFVSAGPPRDDEAVELAGAGGLKDHVRTLHASGVDVSVLIGPDVAMVKEARKLEVDFVSLNVSSFASARSSQDALVELEAIEGAALAAVRLGMRVMVTHGASVRNLPSLASLGTVEEAVVGRELFQRALFAGLDRAFGELRNAAQWYGLHST
jgi:pyridoxine 5'-phosphate synthase PdxJ